jgi:uncharacterized protein YndB with AHSA1/START domain
MKKSEKMLTVKVERTIPASPKEVFNGWLNAKVPGTPWYEGDRLIFNPKVDGLFYWYISGTPHYGRFNEIKQSARIQHTWMSPYTSGLESTVTVTFKKKGKDTLRTSAIFRWFSLDLKTFQKSMDLLDFRAGRNKHAFAPRRGGFVT